MALITSPVPQIGADNGSEQVDTTNLLQDLKNLLNGGLEVDNLSTVLRSVVAPPVLSGVPGSPVDGQMFRFVADAGAGVVWTFRFRAAASDTAKWEMVGGAPARSTGVQTPIGFPAYGWPGAYSQPGLLVPFSGEYDVTVSGRVESGLADPARGYLSFYTFLQPASDAGAFVGTASAGGFSASGSRTTRVRLAAGENVFLQARSGTQVDVLEPQISLIPVRVI